MASAAKRRRELERDLKEAREELAAFTSDWALKGQVLVTISNIHTALTDIAVKKPLVYSTYVPAVEIAHHVAAYLQRRIEDIEAELAAAKTQK
jgi:hypothetical protein